MAQLGAALYFLPPRNGRIYLCFAVMGFQIIFSLTRFVFTHVRHSSSSSISPLNISRPHRSAHDLVGTIDFPLGLARQAVDAFAMIESAVAQAALRVLLPGLKSSQSTMLAGVDESKSAENEPNSGDSDIGKNSTAISFEDGLAVTAALTVHTEGLWVWLSVKNEQGEPTTGGGTGGGQGSALTMAETTAALLAAQAVLTSSVAEAVQSGVRNVPLKRSLSRPVHFEIMHTDLPRKQSSESLSNAAASDGLPVSNDSNGNYDIFYQGFPGDGLGDSNSQPGASPQLNSSHSVDFEQLLQRRHSQLISAKAELLSLRARTMSRIASGEVQPSVATEEEHRMEGVQEDLKSLVNLLLLNSEAEEVNECVHSCMEDSCYSLFLGPCFHTCHFSRLHA